MVTLISATVKQESWESILFQPVLKAYPTCHSWNITVHVSLGNLGKMEDVCTADKKKTTTINSLQQKCLAPIYVLSALQAELENLDSIYTSYKPIILTVTQLLRKEPFNKCTKRSLLPILGDALSCLTGTETTKGVRSIKIRVNQLIVMQHQQKETLAYIISILNGTRYTTQVNRQLINLVMEAVERTHQDITMLYNITSPFYISLSY